MRPAPNTAPGPLARPARTFAPRASMPATVAVVASTVVAVLASAAGAVWARGVDDAHQAGARTEPTVDELCRAAVALALAEPERARSFILRARAAGWLPELRFRVFRRFARTEGLTLDDTATTTPVDVSGVDDVRYEWRATWDLSRMVFNPDELQAHAEALRMADVRRDIQSLVIRLYFERRRLLTTPRRAGVPGVGSDKAAATADDASDRNGPAIVTPNAAEAQGERRQLRVLELEAQLEALSGVPFPPQGASSGASPEGLSP